jgi:hypothetical protein
MQTVSTIGLDNAKSVFQVHASHASNPPVLASKRASCDLSTLSAPDGHERTQTDGPEAAQGNKVQR